MPPAHLETANIATPNPRDLYFLVAQCGTKCWGQFVKIPTEQTSINSWRPNSQSSHPCLALAGWSESCVAENRLFCLQKWNLNRALGGLHTRNWDWFLHGFVWWSDCGLIPGFWLVRLTTLRLSLAACHWPGPQTRGVNLSQGLCVSALNLCLWESRKDNLAASSMRSFETAAACMFCNLGSWGESGPWLLSRGITGSY